MSRRATWGVMKDARVLLAAMATPPGSPVLGGVNVNQSEDGQDDDSDILEDGEDGEISQHEASGQDDGSKQEEDGQDGEDGQDDEAGAGNGAHKSWKVNEPQPLPLTFRVPTSATTWKTEQLNKTVNFSSKASVTAANKAARQIVLRARNALGLPPLRSSTKGREYDQERDNAIEALYVDFAVGNNSARISYSQLAERYNELYPGENRSTASISSHVDKTVQLKAVRDKYEKS